MFNCHPLCETCKENLCLKCFNNKCQCFQNQYFDENLKQCDYYSQKNDISLINYQRKCGQDQYLYDNQCFSACTYYEGGIAKSCYFDIDNFHTTNYFSIIEDALFRSFFFNPQIQKLYFQPKFDPSKPLKFTKSDDGNQILLNKYIFQISQQDKLCRINYFGPRCQYNLKKCLFGSNKQCLFCSIGYFLFNHSCHKCQEDCQVCEYNVKKKSFQCLLPTEGYYINQKGYVQKCFNSCYLCNQKGECLSKIQLMSQLQSCLADQYCLFGNIIKCSNKSIISLNEQICYKIESDNNIFQYVQSTLEQEITFLGNYTIPFVDQLIVVLINTNDKFKIFQNEQIDKILIFSQLRELLIQKLEEELSYDEQQLLFSQGLQCTKKQYHLKKVKCAESKLNENMLQIEQQCFSQFVCQYNLTLQNVQIRADNKYVISYQEIQYLNLDQLINSIQDIGISYGQITINATLYLKSLLYQLDYSLMVEQENLQIRFLNTQINLIITFEIEYNYLSTSFNKIYLKADKISIKNIKMHGSDDLLLYITCQYLTIINTLIVESNFYLYIVQAEYVVINETNVVTNFQNKNVSIISLSNLVDVIVQDFSILQSYLYENIFQFAEMVQNFEVEEINIYQSQLFDISVFSLLQVGVVKMNGFNIAQSNFDNSSLIFIKEIHSFTMTKLQILDTGFFFAKYQVQLVEGYYIYMEQIMFENCTFEQSNFFYSFKFRQMTFNNSRIRLRQASDSEFLNYLGNSLIIQHLIIDVLFIERFVIISINSIYLNIDTLYFNHVGSNSMKYLAGSFLFKFIVQCGEFRNLYIARCFLFSQGLLRIESHMELIFQNITLRSISIGFLQQVLPYAIMIQNYKSKFSISELYITDVQIFDEYVFNIVLIAVIGLTDQLTINNAFIHKMNSQSQQNYLFFISNLETKMHNINVQNIVNFNIFKIESQSSLFNQLYFKNNYNNRDIFTFVSSSKYLYQAIYISGTTIINLNGSFFSNSFYNKIPGEVLIVNLSIYGIESQRLFTVLGISFNLIDLKIRGYKSSVQRYYEQLLLFDCQEGIVKIFNISISNIQMLFGRFFKVTSVLIVKLQISNIHLQEEFSQNLTYLDIAPIFNAILMDIQLTDSSLLNIQFLLLQTISNKIGFYNFQIRNFLSDQSLFQLRLLQPQNVILVDTIYLENLNGNIPFFEYQNEYATDILMYLNNVFIHNCENTLILAKQIDVNVQINNSLIHTLNTQQKSQDFKVDLFQSSIITTQSFNFIIKKQQNSFIFNSQLEEILSDDSLSIKITFNQGKSFLSSKRVDDVNQIMLDKDTDSYFYLPSGQIINEYKRLDLIRLQYEVVYQGFGLYFKGQSSMSCNITSTYQGKTIEVFNYKQIVLKQGLNQIEKLISVINPFNSDYVQNDIQCENYTLRFNTKAFRCQLGEYIFQNQCLQCDIQKGLYSTQYNSTHCYNVNYNKIEQLKIGLIKLRKDYWRFNYSTIFIEQCNNQQHCTGGWTTGDHSCNSSRIGAMCQECDLYNRMGNGHYTKNINNCQLCDVNYSLISQYILGIIWQFFINYLSYYSNNFLYRQFVLYKVGYKNFYQVLYRLSIDQANLIIKLLLNYFFYMYLIRDNFDYALQSVVININYMNNPTLIMSAQLDCLFYRLNNVNIIYIQLLFPLFNVFIILNIIYFFYLVSIKLKLQKFQIRFLLIITSDLFIYNLKIIMEVSFKLLTYQTISDVKWITQNVSYLYYSDDHVYIVTNYILPLTIILLLLPVLILVFIKMGVTIQIKLRKILTVYYQSYKSSCYFWEYIFIFIKILLIGVAILNNQQLQIQQLFIMLLILIIIKIQPYYLKNINQVQQIILIVYQLDLVLLLIKQMDIIKTIGLLIINIYLIVYLAPLILKKISIFHRQKILDTKIKVITRFPNLNRFLRPDVDARIFKNIQYLKKTVRRKYLLRKDIHQDPLKADLPYQFIVSKLGSAEIEMVEIK